ncbi:type II toxin-antitoxin system HicB family antitoxin [Bacteroidales bacterium OttesenSCG-928-C03]|nr:type II toxin-antitoxin system HicB family antitoxin [Bacteroidales bacterium OttesenSCG-928-C03]MDL2326741.1 type II toxin-antitoxin system HicB family antitoxin [Bacteroidales bacterium OttesenSCG-928-A14]
MEYTAIIEKTDDGWYVAQCLEVPGALTQGKSIEEVKENLKDAIKLCLDYEKDRVLKNLEGHKFIRRKVTV